MVNNNNTKGEYSRKYQQKPKRAKKQRKKGKRSHTGRMEAKESVFSLRERHRFETPHINSAFRLIRRRKSEADSTKELAQKSVDSVLDLEESINVSRRNALPSQVGVMESDSEGEEANQDQVLPEAPLPVLNMVLILVKGGYLKHPRNGE